MLHQFVTVCVFCVLCAAHTSCSAHTEFSTVGKPGAGENVESGERLDPSLIKSKDAQQLKDTKRLSLTLTNHRRARGKLPGLERSSRIRNVQDTEEKSFDEHETSAISVREAEILERLGQTPPEGSAGPVKNSRERGKREATVYDQNYFMKKIFEAYGDGTSVTIEGFEKLLRKLNLLRLLINESRTEAVGGQWENKLESGKSTHMNSQLEVENAASKDRCLTSNELLNSIAWDTQYTQSTSNSVTLPHRLFERVCPVLLYQLAGESSSERSGCIRVPENYKPITIDVHGEDSGRNMIQVWVYSTISILIISLCGLLGVAVIPVMGKIYYHQLLQFLIALAIGTLCGDALIHLLPHAMMSPMVHHHDGHHDNDHVMPDHEDLHNLNMWKGLVAMIGLVLFFFAEKALTMFAKWRKLRQRRNKLPSRVRVMRETDGPNSNVVGEKLCKHKYSSYPYCYGEITTDTQDNHHNRQHNNHERPPVIEEEKPLTSNCNSVSKIMANDIENKPNEDWRLDESIMNNGKKNTDGADVPLNETESYTVIIREHETKHHGHTHSHGHVHSAPESMSSVAWMVVMGDGLHNFTDGMAIGAAFSANIAGGFSTAIAVFCHELPHEIGDFAVLLKAGMSAKQAVFYNLLSSVLCLFGMVFGVLLGSTPSATSWMFAAAAGMFIYIALVDMIPELSSSHSSERSSQWQCVLQALGLCCGLGIMLIIALYEHDLKNIFSD